MIYGATFVLAFAVISGFFLPGWLRVGIADVIVGLCAPFLAEGLRRAQTARKQRDGV